MMCRGMCIAPQVHTLLVMPPAHTLCISAFAPGVVELAMVMGAGLRPPMPNALSPVPCWVMQSPDALAT